MTRLADDIALLKRPVASFEGEGVWTRRHAEALSRVLDNVRDLRNALVDMTAQHCGTEDAKLNAHGLSANRDAMRLLADLGLVKITGGEGRGITGEWISTEISPE